MYILKNLIVFIPSLTKRGQLLGITQFNCRLKSVHIEYGCVIKPQLLALSSHCVDMTKCMQC